MLKSPTKKSPVSKEAIAVNKNWNVTNNSGADIVAIHAYTNEVLPTAQLYEQSLALLETTDGNKNIPSGSTAVVPLTGTYESYTVIMAKADNFFPVHLIDPADSNTGNDVTVTADDVARLKLAESFLQKIIAFPSSAMATGYADALTNADQEGIDAFFQACKGYETLKLNMVLAVQTYFNRFPFVWAGNTASKNYYLYTSDGTINKYYGYVSLSNQCTPPLDTLEVMDKFTADFINLNESESTTLYYADGQFVDDLEKDNPAICLQGLFIQKSQLTKVDTDNMLITLLKGTVNGKDVFGYEVKEKKDKNGNWIDLDVLHNPTDTKAWLELAGVVVLSVLGLYILGKTAKCLIDFVKKSTKLTPEEIAAKNVEIRAKNTAKTQATLNKIDKLLKITDDYRTSADRLKRTGDELLLQENKTKLWDAANHQQQLYDKLIDYGNPSSMKKVNANLTELNDLLINTPDPRILADRMGTLLEELKFNSGTFRDQARSAASKLSDAENKAIDNSQKALDKITETIERNEEIRQELLEDEIPEIPETEG